MFIVPASNTSVPLLDVIRTRSSVSDKAFDPPKTVPLGTADPVEPEADQIFEPIKHIVATPEKRFEAADWLYTVKFAVVETVLTVDAESAVCDPT